MTNITDTMTQIRHVINLAKSRLETLKECKEIATRIVDNSSDEIKINRDFLKAGRFEKFVYLLDLQLDAISDQWQVIREARREARAQAVLNLELGTELKLASGLLVQVVSKCHLGSKFTAKIIDEESLVHDIGEILELSPISLSKSTIVKVPFESRYTYKVQAINEFAANAVKAGFKVYLSQSTPFCYALIGSKTTNRCMLVQYDIFEGISFTGCYQSNAKSGNGWGIADNQPTYLNASDLDKFINMGAPQWANANPVYMTLEQKLKNSSHSKYVLLHWSKK